MCDGIVTHISVSYYPLAGNLPQLFNIFMGFSAVYSCVLLERCFIRVGVLMWGTILGISR